MTTTNYSATVTAARAPFVKVALAQAGELKTPEAQALARRLVDGVDSLAPEVFYPLSGRLDALHRCSPIEQARARGRVLDFKKEATAAKREASRAALGFAGTKAGRSWL